MSSKKTPKRRSPTASALALPIFRAQRVPSAKLYRRRPRSQRARAEQYGND